MIDKPHTTLITLQFQMSIVYKASHLRGYLKPSRQIVPNAQLHNK